MARRRSRNGQDELFLSNPTENELTTPTVAPLRIDKHNSSQPIRRMDSTATSVYDDDVPPTPKDYTGLPDLPQLPGFPAPPQPPNAAHDRPSSRGNRYPPQQNSYSTRPEPKNKGAPLAMPPPPSMAGGLPSLPSPPFLVSPIDMAGGLAGRRKGNKDLPESPGPVVPLKDHEDFQEDDDDLFAKPVRRETASPPAVASSSSRPVVPPYPDKEHQYWGPSQGLAAPIPQQGVNRLASNASVSTTRASRGSPPPPETPAIASPGAGTPFDNDLAARYAASGIPGTATLTAMQAAQLQPRQASAPVSKPWSPEEDNPDDDPVVYQGSSATTSDSPKPQAKRPPPAPMPGVNQSDHRIPTQNNETQALEDHVHRMQLTDDAPPAYSSLSHDTPPAVAPEKQQYQAPQKQPMKLQESSSSVQREDSMHVSQDRLTHPAFQDDPNHTPGQQTAPVDHPPVQQFATVPDEQAGPSTAAGALMSPPQLPEGWIAHLDPNTNSYYYIHMETSSTQWEFPKSSVPLNLSSHPQPMKSPALSQYDTKPMASAGFGMASPGFGMASPGFGMASPGMPHTPYAESMMSVASPMSSAFNLPPASGVDMYQDKPSNGVYFGPYLRFINIDLQAGVWLGSIMLITDIPSPPTINIHQSEDLRPNPPSLQPQQIHTHKRWCFFRYNISLKQDQTDVKYIYAVTSHLGCSRFEFLLPGYSNPIVRFIAHSHEDFAISVSQNERNKLGGVAVMYRDIIQKHEDCGGFHYQIGCGNAIDGTRLFKETSVMREWISMPKERRVKAAFTQAHEAVCNDSYLHYWTSTMDQLYVKEAIGSIPSMAAFGTHDVFDGVTGEMSSSPMFRGIQGVAKFWYYLMQNHATADTLLRDESDQDLFSVSNSGSGLQSVRYLGPALAVVTMDTLSERKDTAVMEPSTWQGIFPRIATLAPSVQHCIILTMPVVSPRLEAMESLNKTMATGKSAVNTGYNLLGRSVSGLAGLVGGKEAVAGGFASVKKLVGKEGLMANVISPFGQFELAQDVADTWQNPKYDLERTYFVRTLTQIAKQRSLRMTWLCPSLSPSLSLIHDPSRSNSHTTMYQLATGSLVDAPPASYKIKLMNGDSTPHYIPANGVKTKPGVVSDLKEDVIPVFNADESGASSGTRKFVGARSYIAAGVYDPGVIEMGAASGRYNLAADIFHQVGEGTVKTGPIVIPNLGYGQ